MMFRNSIRLLFSNFSMVWKILLYQIITLLVTFSVATIFAMPLINTLKTEGFLTLLQTEYSNISMNFNLASILNSVYIVGESFFSIISNNLSTTLLSLILSGFVIIFVGGFLFGLSRLAMAEVIHGYMSSHANYSFTGAYVRTFKKSVALQFAMLVVNTPINILIIYIIYKSFSLLTITTGIIDFLAPFLIILIATILFSINLTIFSGVIPAVTIHNCSVFKGYKLGYLAVKRRFFKTLSTSIVLILAILSFNLFFFALTSGASFVITLPSSIFLLAIFPMVMYYGSMGMRYYVDPETILSPKKLEEQDKISNTKFII